MDPVIRVREYLLDNVGHMTLPGTPTFDSLKNRWMVPVLCKSDRGPIVVGDVELDQKGDIVFAPSRQAMLERLNEAVCQQ